MRASHSCVCWEPVSAFHVPLISIKVEVLQGTGGLSPAAGAVWEGKGRQNQQALVCLAPYMSSVEASRSK